MTEDGAGETRATRSTWCWPRPARDGEVDDPETWPRFRMLWPHLEVSDAVTSPDEAVRQLIIDRVRYLWLRGDLGRRRSGCAERDRRGWTELLDDADDPTGGRSLRRQLLHLRFNLANILRDLGRFERVPGDSTRTCCAEQRELLGDGPPAHADDRRRPGRRPARRWAATARRWTATGATYAAWLENFGEDHPRTLAALNNLAVSYRLMGDFRAARDARRDGVRRGGGSCSATNIRHPELAGQHSAATCATPASTSAPSRVLRGLISASYAGVLGPRTRAKPSTPGPTWPCRCAAPASSPRRPQLLEDAYERLNDSFGPDSPDTLACRLSLALNLLALGDTIGPTGNWRAVHEAYQRQPRCRPTRTPWSARSTWPWSPAPSANSAAPSAWPARRRPNSARSSTRTTRTPWPRP